METNELRERLLGGEIHYCGETGPMDFKVDYVDAFDSQVLGELLFLSSETSNQHLLIKKGDVMRWLDGKAEECDVLECSATFCDGKLRKSK